MRAAGKTCHTYAGGKAQRRLIGGLVELVAFHRHANTFGKRLGAFVIGLGQQHEELLTTSSGRRYRCRVSSGEQLRTSRSTSSPTRCPYVSFTRLK
jgi:hypothetical protein